MLADGNTFERILDYAFDTPAGRLSLFRSYTSSSLTWNYQGTVNSPGELYGVPTPFGSSVNGSVDVSLRWWHNFYAFATQIHLPGNGPLAWEVRDHAGLNHLFFPGCGATVSEPCGCPRADAGTMACQLDSYGTASKSRLVDLTYQGTNQVVSLMLILANGMKLYYGGYDDAGKPVGKFANTLNQSHPYYFLTRMENAKGQILAYIDYVDPANPGYGGAPYVARVRVPGASPAVPGVGTLNFYYNANYTLDHVTTVTAVSASGVQTEQLVVTYAYTGPATGLLQSVLKTSGTENYSYTDSSGASVFAMSVDGLQLVKHTYQNGYVNGASTPNDTLMVSQVSADAGVPYNCMASPFLQATAVRNSSASAGSFGSNPVSLTQQYNLEASSGSHDWRPTNISTTCDPSAPYSCSPGSMNYMADCTNPYRFETGIQNKRGYWTTFGQNLPRDDAGVVITNDPVHVEKGFAEPGQSTPNFNSADPNNTAYSYAYYRNDPGDRRIDEQLPSSVFRTSALQPSARMEERTLYQMNTDDRTDAGNYPVPTAASKRPRAKIRHGWTQTLDTNGNPQITERYVGTFYFNRYVCAYATGIPDPHDRILEVHGPCLVDNSAGFSATDCSATLNSQVPATQYYYNPDPSQSDGGVASVSTSSGQLAKIIQFEGGNTPSVCNAESSRTLVTEFLSYDANGHPTQVRDPNQVVTTYTYTDGLPTQLTVGGQTTTFVYDHRKLSLVSFPAGNALLMCYRAPGSNGSCSGGWTGRLQYRALVSAFSTSGSTWSERIDYTYAADGTVAEEAYRDSSGSIRRVHKRVVDAQKRPTGEGWGPPGTPNQPAFARVHAYDGDDNLTGIGLPYNAAPAWCGGVQDVVGGAPISSLCAALHYDPLDRLDSMTEQPTSSTTQRTWFSYDFQGNVTGVKVGCGSADSSYSACTQPASTYTYDDFGNVVSANIAGATSGARNWEYSALGGPLKMHSAAMATGEYQGWNYDDIGRVLSSYDMTTSAQTFLYSYGYSSAILTPSSCPASTFAASATLSGGRTRYRQDSFGFTWFFYDAVGHVLQEYRMRDGTCSGLPNNNPITTYTYTPNGDLATIAYPYGRSVTYSYGTGALASRVSSVQVSQFNGTSWQSTPLISNVIWEPFGGLRSYQILSSSGQPMKTIEYFLGSNGSSPGCPSTPPAATDNDSTGRLRGLWVSTAGGSAPGDVLKLTYTWQADQISETDTCLLGGTTPRIETFGYDRTLRLTTASRPTGNFASTGGAFSSRSYSYDARGNRTSVTNDGLAPIASSFASPMVDQMTGFGSSASGSYYRYSFSFDPDGRVSTKLGAKDSTYAASTTTNYTSGLNAAAATDTVFRSVTIQGAAYNYFYDALGRRRVKSYPTGISDEYFYDLNHQLLVDQGNSGIYTPVANYALDEYVWLGGRPISVIRSNLSTSWAHQADGTGTCPRNGEAANCGVYFPVTDVIAKPILMLNAAGQVAGTGEYDPFGHVNRVFIDAETPHPYGAFSGTFADFTQAVGSGLSLSAQVRVDLLDLEYRATGIDQCPDANDSLNILDGSSGTVLASLQGRHDGLLSSGWVQPSAGRLKLSVASGGGPCSVSYGCNPPCYKPPCSCYPRCIYTCSAASTKKGTGVVAGYYEYRRYQTGTQPFWTPLRFPGQYYDAESDLFENWNRYYDGQLGRYLEPEPLLFDPLDVVGHAKGGHSSPAYAYAFNNPSGYTDIDGFGPVPVGCTNTYDCCVQRLGPEACGGSEPVPTPPPSPPSPTPRPGPILPPYFPRPDSRPSQDCGSDKWSCTAQCTVTAIPARAPASFPPRVYGTGSGSSEDKACDDAKSDATQKSPLGTYPRHCKCDCVKR